MHTVGSDEAIVTNNSETTLLLRNSKSPPSPSPPNAPALFCAPASPPEQQPASYTPLRVRMQTHGEEGHLVLSMLRHDPNAVASPVATGAVTFHMVSPNSLPVEHEAPPVAEVQQTEAVTPVGEGWLGILGMGWRSARLLSGGHVFLL